MSPAADMVKLVFTVPESHAEIARQTVGDAGGGIVGNYAHCSFSVKGTGRFVPREGANPAVGSVGAPEEVVEERIEITCERAKLPQIIESLRKVHPYEEPAIDIYPLSNL